MGPPDLRARSLAGLRGGLAVRLAARHGLRRFRTAYCALPRTLSAGIALYLLVADGEQGAEVYSAATSRDPTERIDGIVAIIMAIGRAMVAQEEPQPEYSLFFV